jgi:hypothetical protein
MIKKPKNKRDDRDHDGSEGRTIKYFENIELKDAKRRLVMIYDLCCSDAGRMMRPFEVISEIEIIAKGKK